MIYNIPLPSPKPYFGFSVQLSGRTLELQFRWLYLYGFYAVDVYEEGQALTLGRGLHPQMNILAYDQTGLGSLYLEGDQPTLENLGVANRLRYNDAPL